MKKCKEDKNSGDKQEYFSFKKKRRRKKRKIIVRQKEEFQKEATKTFILKAKLEKERMKKIAKRGNLFFHQTILPSGKSEKHFLGESSQKGFSKKICFSNFSFFWVKTFQKEKNRG